MINAICATYLLLVQLGSAAITDLCSLTTTHKVRKVTIARSNLADSEALSLANFLCQDGSSVLEVLMLDGNIGIGDEGAEALGKMLACNQTLHGATAPPSLLTRSAVSIQCGHSIRRGARPLSARLPPSLHPSFIHTRARALPPSLSPYL